MTDLLSSHYDDFSGVTTEYWYDHSNDSLTINRKEDIQAILEHNKRLMADSLHQKHGTGALGTHYATIPNTVVEQFLKEGIDIYSADPEMKRKVKRKLMDPDYKYLRTFRGNM